MSKYLFIDRDGVVNKDPGDWTETGYVTKWEDFYFLPRVLESLKKATDSGYRVVIISNQQCVGKGYITSEELDDLTDNIKRAMKEAGVDVAGIYYCVHKKDDECSCRKPKPGLFHMAQDEFEIKDLKNCFYIGDSARDIVAGKKAGMKTILVLSGKSEPGEVDAWEDKPDHVCKDLDCAVDIALEEGE